MDTKPKYENTRGNLGNHFNEIDLWINPLANPDGAYAAVIPKWINLMLNQEEIFINGDGSTSRDFCYIDNAVQANILAALAKPDANNNIYNIAVGERTNLNELVELLKESLKKNNFDYEKKNASICRSKTGNA